MTSAQTVSEIAEKALAATVHLEMKDRNGKTLAFGSGFFVRKNQIATNFHVVEGAAKGTAKPVGKTRKYAIKIISATDKENDLACLKVSGYRGEPLPLADSDGVKIGETVYVAGNPIRLEGTFSDGIISSIRGSTSRKLLQMTAPISPGSSGGPVLNGKGEVIGVSVATIEGGQNLNFAIPSNYLKSLLRQIAPAKALTQSNRFISAEIYYKQGLEKHNSGKHSAAIGDFSEAIRIKSDYAAAYYNRGRAKYDLGLYSAAVADYDDAIRLKPDYAAAYYDRGIALYDLDAHGAAIVDYNKAIRLKPGYAEAYNSRGIAMCKLGKHFSAISDYDEAIRLKPDYAEAYKNRGVVNVIVGRTGAAKQDLNTALKLVDRTGDESLKATIEKVLKLIE